MGLLVPEVILPSGNTASNVYVTFHNSMVYTFPIDGTNYRMSAFARVYETPEMITAPLYEFEVNIPNSDLSKGPFANVYAALKDMFPTGVYYQEGN